MCLKGRLKFLCENFWELNGPLIPEITLIFLFGFYLQAHCVLKTEVLGFSLFFSGVFKKCSEFHSPAEIIWKGLR